jgi:hypothetical protein
MSIQRLEPINQVALLETSAEHAWGVALFSLMSAVGAVHEMAQSDTYRDMAVQDLDQITEAALAINLTWSQLKARRAA